ncbi:MAG: hypothetical protein RIR59_757, partial [Pseudomonadota bacterium]
MLAPNEIAQTVIDPACYQDNRIHDALQWLRREMPVAKIVTEQHTPFWIVTRHADIMSAELRPDDFCNSRMATTLPTDFKNLPPAAANMPMPRVLTSMDGSDHRAFRRLTQSYFAPQNIKKLEARIRELARRSIDAMADAGGECDFMRDVALMYPLRVIMEILGVPEADEAYMLKITQEIFGGEDKDLARSGDAEGARTGIRDAVMEAMGYFGAMVADRKRNPRDDLASVIANGEIGGEPIGISEILGYYLITATAGHDTTSNTTATGLWALAERPELLAQLKADASLLPGHV